MGLRMNNEGDLVEKLFIKSPKLKNPPGSIIAAQKVLVLAPHQDDEALGCGGTILKYLEAGAKVIIVYLTDGRYGVTKGAESTRRLEAEAAWANYPEVIQYFWDFEDSHLNPLEVRPKLKEVILRYLPEVILTPWFLDRHIDHRLTGICLKETILNLDDVECWIVCYEVLYPLLSNMAVDITNYMEDKLNIISSYQSQSQLLKLEEVAVSLNKYRGILLRLKRIKYAEGFFAADRKFYVEVINKFLLGGK